MVIRPVAKWLIRKRIPSQRKGRWASITSSNRRSVNDNSPCQRRLDRKVFSEKVSSVAKREQLDAALENVREGYVFIVTKLDRLARSVAHLVGIGARLEAKGVGLKVLDQAIDTSSPSGRLMFNMLGSIAQFERELMLERQREGIAKAKAEGKYKGRKPTARARG